ncbi:MAG TPA: response regulator [Kofleriaceae bacterium]|nr:response regulator [Kofleriaceae bacterium]
MSRRCALIVDDSSTMRQLIGFAVRRIPGLDLVEAENGVEALRLLDERSFDLILLDINMPVMSGFTLLEQLQARTDVPPVIVVTTEDAQEDIDRALALGAAAYVMKPVTGPVLVDAIRQVIGD